VLHKGLMEAALERSAREGGIGAGELAFCAQCEMPLPDHAAFCNACGAAVRVQPKQVRPKAAVGAAPAEGSIVPGFDRAEESPAGPASGAEAAPSGSAEQPDTRDEEGRS
jgi:hypothetical protein